MTIHWPLVILGAFLYLLVGMIQGLVLAFIRGRRGQSEVAELDGLILVFFWPVMNGLCLLFLVFSKFCDLLEFCRKRGAESVLPKDEPARRID